jgi:hypothetical protein
MLAGVKDMRASHRLNLVRSQGLHRQRPAICGHELDLVGGAIGMYEDNGSDVSRDQPKIWQVCRQGRKI